MSAQHWTWIAGGAALAVMVIAAIAEHRRNNRKRIDDYGWMPWRGIQVAAFFAAVAAVIAGTKLS